MESFKSILQFVLLGCAVFLVLAQDFQPPAGMDIGRVNTGPFVRDLERIPVGRLDEIAQQLYYDTTYSKAYIKDALGKDILTTVIRRVRSPRRVARSSRRVGHYSHAIRP